MDKTTLDRPFQAKASAHGLLPVLVCAYVFGLQSGMLLYIVRGTGAAKLPDLISTGNGPVQLDVVLHGTA